MFKITLEDIYSLDTMPEGYLGRFKNLSKKDKDILWRFIRNNRKFKMPDKVVVKIYRDYSKTTKTAKDINYEDFIKYMEQIKLIKPHLFV